MVNRRFFVPGGLVSAVLLLLTLRGSSFAITFYVTTDGGTASQCNGRADGAYPGAGANQNCAWSHPFYALNNHGQWKLRSGDTLLIGAGSYRIGFGAPNTGWCDRDGSFDCHFPPLPSGIDPSHPTQILGAGWNSGCRNRPELWGTQRASYLLNLDGTSNAAIQCLELTDHSGCVEFHATNEARCQRDNDPYGDWASIGIYAKDSRNVKLSDLNIHGFASTGINAGRLSNWTLTRVRIAGNGWVGWDGDLAGEGDSNSGTMRFKRWIVEWNGCAESYPQEEFSHCWAQQSGGYGDGVGTGPTGGRWIIEDSVFRHNTSDGLDLLYVGRAGAAPGKIEIRRTIAEGNAGNQIKVNGAADIVNTLMIGNCGYFFEKSFAREMGVRQSGDHCRASGGTLAINLLPGSKVNLINSTVVGQGDTLVEIECEDGNCAGNSQVILQNNIFRGYSDFLQPGDRTAFVYDPGRFSSGRIGYNLEYGSKNQVCRAPNICANPRFVNDDLTNFDGHLLPGSRAIDSGLPVGSLNGLVPDHDIIRISRPQGNGVDRGAYEISQ